MLEADPLSQDLDVLDADISVFLFPQAVSLFAAVKITIRFYLNIHP